MHLALSIWDLGWGHRPLDTTAASPRPRTPERMPGGRGQSCQENLVSNSRARVPHESARLPPESKGEGRPSLGSRDQPGTAATSLSTPKPLSLGPRFVICTKGGRVETGGHPVRWVVGVVFGGHEHQVWAGEHGGRGDMMGAGHSGCWAPLPLTPPKDPPRALLPRRFQNHPSGLAEDSQVGPFPATRGERGVGSLGAQLLHAGVPPRRLDLLQPTAHCGPVPQLARHAPPDEALRPLSGPDTTQALSEGPSTDGRTDTEGRHSTSKRGQARGLRHPEPGRTAQGAAWLVGRPPGPRTDLSGRQEADVTASSHPPGHHGLEPR